MNPERIAPRGVDIAVKSEGEGSPVLMLHGVGSALDSFDAMSDGLVARGHRTLRYDLRGHGESGKPPGPYRLQDFIDDATDVLDHAGVDRADLVGFSFGGMIAQAVAIACPQRVRRLVLISSVAARTPEEKQRMRDRADQLETRGFGGIAEAALERWFTPQFRESHPEVVQHRIERARNNDPVGYSAAYRVFAESDIDAPLAEIAAPTLVMTGEHDQGSSPRMARLIHERVANSRLRILDGLRHNVIAEAPDLLLREIDEFFDAVG